MCRQPVHPGANGSSPTATLLYGRTSRERFEHQRSDDAAGGGPCDPVTHTTRLSPAVCRLHTAELLAVTASALMPRSARQLKCDKPPFDGATSTPSRTEPESDTLAIIRESLIFSRRRLTLQRRLRHTPTPPPFAPYTKRQDALLPRCSPTTKRSRARGSEQGPI